LLQKGEFTDDVILLALSRVAACDAIRVYVEMASSLGLADSFVKTKFMVVGTTVSGEDKCPLAVSDDFIEWVKRFPYLGSLISDDERIDAVVDRRIANTPKSFGALQHAIFKILTCLLRLSSLC